MLTKVRNKEDLVRAGKPVGQTKISFAKRSKTIPLLYSNHQQSFCFFISSQIDDAE